MIDLKKINVIYVLLILTTIILSGCTGSGPYVVEKPELCSDSDKGLNYFVKGTTKGIDESSGEFGSATDYCLDDVNMKEYVCEGQYGKETEYDCPYGCVDGACVKELPEESCRDSENGIDYYVNGELTVCMFGAEEPGDEPGMMCATHNDLCGDGINTDGDVLFEKYCDGSELKIEQYECPYGCESGACLQLIERCQFPAGMDCIDKAATTEDSMQIALRNNIGFTIEINSAKGMMCTGISQLGVGASDSYKNIDDQEVPNNEVFRIKLQGCTFDSDSVEGDVEVLYTNVETGLQHSAVGNIISKIN